MTYDVTITPAAEKRLRKFSSESQRRFSSKIEKLKDEPRVYGKPLRKPLAGKWELKFERRWRIIYTISEEDKLVEIEAVLHKKEL